MRNLRFTFFLFLVLLTLSGCSSLAPIVGGVDSADGIDIESSSDDDANNFGAAGESLPISFFNSDNVLLYSPDANDSIPVVATEGFVTAENDLSDSNGDGYADYRLAISTDESDLEMATASIEEPSTFFGLSFTTFRNAYADVSDIQYCNIRTNGQVENCYYDFNNASQSQLYLAVVDAENNVISESLTENIHGNLLYTVNEPTDVSVASDAIYSIVNDITVKTTTNDDNDTVMAGDHYNSNGAYREFDAGGARFAFDSENSYFGFLDSSGGITVVDLDGNQIGRPRLIDGTTSYTKIKTTYSNGVYFGVEKNSTDESYLYSYRENFDTLNFIQFISLGDLDSDGGQLNHAKTISFDINTNGYALILYQDADQNFRLRASNNEAMFGGELTLAITNIENASQNFSDISFVNDSKALLMDSGNDKIWIIDLDTNAQTVTYELDGLANAIDVGDNPVSLTFNSDRSRAYVLNRGTLGENETVSIINLKNSDGSVRLNPQVVAEVVLEDLIADKDLIFEPNTIVHHGEQLFVACENTNSLLLITSNDFDESSLADEDNDDDGYTASEGDCNDNDASLNPETLWYEDFDGDGYAAGDDEFVMQCEQPVGYVREVGDCDDDNENSYPNALELCDEVDNDCDGEVDENVVVTTWYLDNDGDGFGDADSSLESCSQPIDYVSDNTDCNDDEETAYPGNEEICDDGIDNDCGGGIDEGCEGEL